MLYLSSIMDLYNGEIIAGSVYTSNAYQMAIKQRGFTMSMSRKGNTR